MPRNWENSYLLSVFIFLALVLAVFARTYSFHDWLYFKMDQSRDAFVVANAVENGPEYLPLLGPRAGATEVSNGYLRLGPAFYYFQYISGKIFNSTEPYVFAYPDLFFSILTIPLFYLFLRFYFSRKKSIMITLMYSFSFIVIQYSRFAWNPNSLLFFTLLAFYGMLRFLKSEKLLSKIGWMALWSSGIAIGSQLHFLGLFFLPAISALILVAHFEPWKKTEALKLKNTFKVRRILIYFFTFAIVFSAIYSPVIISDAMRNGENTKNFFQAFSTKPGKKPWAEKISLSLDSQTKYYCLIATSECYKRKVKDNIGFSFLTAILMISGLILAIARIRKETEKLKRDFLRLIIAWFGIFFLIAIPLYASLRPRFFIPVFPLPFIFLGVIMLFLEEKWTFGKKYVAFAITVIIVGFNVRGTMAWFKEQAESQKGYLKIDRTLILKNQDGVTLAELVRAVNYMYKEKEPDSVLYFYVKQEHFSPIKYLFFQKNNPNLIYSRVEKSNDLAGPYFVVVPASKDEKYLKKEFGSDTQVLDAYDAGQIRVYKIKSDIRRDSDKKSEGSGNEATKSDRVFWKDVFKIEEKKRVNVEITEKE